MNRTQWSFLAVILMVFIVGCASREILDYENVGALESVEEYEKKITIKKAEPEKVKEENKGKDSDKDKKGEVKKTKHQLKPALDKKAQKKKKVEDKKGKKMEKQISIKDAKPKKKLPELEDAEGFNGRRPIVDPYRVNEKVVLNISYFNIKAGDMIIETLPFAEVNGRKSYHFKVSVKSNKFFDRFYAVNDWAETFLDYETLLPYNLEVHIKESKQLKESRTFIDHKNKKATFWEKKVTKEKGEQNKKKTWEIEEYSQNVISAAYYIRAHTMKVGKKFKFRVVDAGKNIVVTAEVLAKEKAKTDVGKKESYKVKMEFEVDGIFKKVGDVFIWLTADDQKLPVRVESKIKIGTIIGRLKEIRRGKSN